MRVPPGRAAPRTSETPVSCDLAVAADPLPLEDGSFVQPTNNEEESALRDRHSHF